MYVHRLIVGTQMMHSCLTFLVSVAHCIHTYCHHSCFVTEECHMNSDGVLHVRLDSTVPVVYNYTSDGSVQCENATAKPLE